MTAATDSYVEYVMEQLAPLGGVVKARFFGGTGLSCDGALFAMIMSNALYFAVNDETRPRYIGMGSGCFSYTTKKGRVDVTRFYCVPTETLEDQDALVALARESIRVAGAGKQRPIAPAGRSRAKRAPARKRP